jgi:hypothetical protein
MLYAIYIIKAQPYIGILTNRTEVFNEICVINTTYFLMWLSTHGIDDLETKMSIGWFYIFASSLGIVVNFCILTGKLVRAIPSQINLAKI